MAEFITKRNEENIQVIFDYSSIAKRYRQAKFYILNRDNVKEVYQLENLGVQQVLVSKKDLYEHSRLVVRLQCIVSKDLLNQKETIIKNTFLNIILQDEENTETYISDYSKDPTEYVDKTKYTFVITKYIEITFEG